LHGGLDWLGLNEVVDWAIGVVPLRLRGFVEGFASGLDDFFNECIPIAGSPPLVHRRKWGTSSNLHPLVERRRPRPHPWRRTESRRWQPRSGPAAMMYVQAASIWDSFDL